MTPLLFVSVVALVAGAGFTGAALANPVADRWCARRDRHFCRAEIRERERHQPVADMQRPAVPAPELPELDVYVSAYLTTELHGLERTCCL